MQKSFVLASSLLKLTFPYLLFVSLVALSGAVMNVYNRFAVAALRPYYLMFQLLPAPFYCTTNLAWGRMR
ncbi:lipid II flippase MurJ [Pseudoalteromonas sp. Hal099]